MGNLSRSFVRGFGATLGAMTAKSFVDGASQYSGGGAFGLSTKRQWISVFQWLTGTVFLWLINPVFGVIFLLVGIPIIVYFQKRIQRREDQENWKIEREDLLSKLENVLAKFRENGISINLSNGQTLDSNTSNGEIFNMLGQLNKKMALLEKIKGKYGSSDMEKVLEGKPWIGMTNEMLRDMRGEPDQYEVDSAKFTETFVYGKSVRSGDVFKFKNGELFSIKDR